jgi:hypothetical protein
MASHMPCSINEHSRTKARYERVLRGRSSSGVSPVSITVSGFRKNRVLIRHSQPTSRTPETIDRLPPLLLRAVSSPRFCPRTTTSATGVLHSRTARSRLCASGPVGSVRGCHQARPAIREHPSRTRDSSIAGCRTTPENDRRRDCCAAIY